MHKIRLASRFFQSVIQRMLVGTLVAFIFISLSLLSSVQVLAQETKQAARASVTLIPQGGDFAAKNSPCGDITERFQSGKFEIWHIPCYVQYLSQTFIYFAGGIAVLFLVIGGYQYMIGGISEDKEAGKKTIIYALAGFALTLTAWTLVNVWQVFITSGEDKTIYSVSSSTGTAHFAFIADGTLNKKNWDTYVTQAPSYAQQKFDATNILQAEQEFKGYEFSVDSSKDPVVDLVADGFSAELTCSKKDVKATQTMLITETTQRSATKEAARKCMRALKKFELGGGTAPIEQPVPPAQAESKPVEAPEKEPTQTAELSAAEEIMCTQKATAFEQKLVTRDANGNVEYLKETEEIQQFLASEGKKYADILNSLRMAKGKSEETRPAKNGIDGIWGDRTQKVYELWRKTFLNTRCASKPVASTL